MESKKDCFFQEWLMINVVTYKESNDPDTIKN